MSLRAERSTLRFRGVSMSPEGSTYRPRPGLSDPPFTKGSRRISTGRLRHLHSLGLHRKDRGDIASRDETLSARLAEGSPGYPPHAAGLVHRSRRCGGGVARVVHRRLAVAARADRLQVAQAVLRRTPPGAG